MIPGLILALACSWQAPSEEAPSLGPAQDPGASSAASTEESGSRLIDPEDGWFDVSRFLEQPRGFLPVAVPITEPALGYGLAGGALFLSPREDAGAEGWARPNMTMLGGLWTEDGSDGLFAANSSIWAGGRVHTLVAGGEFGLDLELHGIGEDGTLEDDPLRYQLDLVGAFGESRWRLGRSDFWLGARFAFARAEVSFEGPPSGFAEDDGVTIAGPGFSLRYDSLNNVFTPTSGAFSETSVSLFDSLFGGSRDFQLAGQDCIAYWPLGERVFLGARAGLRVSYGETPFYARPYIDLRGVPTLRYQGDDAASGELELRWQFHERISLVTFGGAGLAWTNAEHFDREQSALTEGLGLRYELARKFGLHAGLDFARGPEENAIYVQFGSAWMRP